MTAKTYTSTTLTRQVGQWLWGSRWGPGLVVGAALLALYLFTLQRTDIASNTEFALETGLDSSRAQAALDLAAAQPVVDFPLYVLVGAPLVWLMGLIGLEVATAAATVSMLWGFAALVVMYDLLRRRSDSPCYAALITLIMGLMQSVWLHSVVAEVYSLYMLLAAIILWVALGAETKSVWTRWRWLGLAFAIGLGTAYHWALALLIPGLLIALGPRLWAGRAMLRPLPLTIALAALLLAAGFLPYLFLSLFASIGDLPDLTSVTHLSLAEIFLGRQAGVEWSNDLSGVGYRVASTLGILATQVTWSAVLAIVFLGPISMLKSRTYSHWEATMLLISLTIYVVFISIFKELLSPEAFLLPAFLIMVLIGGEVVNFILERTPIPTWGAGIALGVIVANLISRTWPLVRALTG